MRWSSPQRRNHSWFELQRTRSSGVRITLHNQRPETGLCGREGHRDGPNSLLGSESSRGEGRSRVAIRWHRVYDPSTVPDLQPRTDEVARN